MNQSIKRVLFIFVAGMILIAACAPAPAPAPTQDPAEIQNQIQESVALTVSAQNVQTEQALALIPEPTNTPLPTQTEAVLPTPILPTATPFVVVPPTSTPITSSGGGGVVVNPEYACTVVKQSPLDNSKWKRNKDFDVNWTIMNTGTKSWQAGLDLVFYSGTNIAKTSNVQLPALKSGEQFKVILDAVTPAQKGTYTMVWKLEGGLCFPSLSITVE